jgi:NAD(P)-dependent dehydrogenase (short-subunit alcohol dehydrogenase family)
VSGEEEAVEGFAAAIREQFGRIDIWVNCATTMAYVASPISRSASPLADEEEIHVMTIVPGSVDTPIFVTAANYTGHRVRPIPPILSPEEVAGRDRRLC